MEHLPQSQIISLSDKERKEQRVLRTLPKTTTKGKAIAFYKPRVNVLNCSRKSRREEKSLFDTELLWLLFFLNYLSYFISNQFSLLIILLDSIL